MGLPQFKAWPSEKKQSYLYVALVLALGIAYLFYARWAGPLYKGSRTRIWVQSVASDARAYDTVLEIGPDAVPFILEEIDRKPEQDSKFIQKLRAILPNFIAQRLPLGSSESPRWRLLELLQHVAVDERSAPQLIKLIKSSSEDWAPIHVLGKLPRIALPQARAWLASSDPTEQLEGLLLAGALGPAGQELAPQVASFARSVDQQMMRPALSALRGMGPTADPYVYEIISSTNETAARWMIGFISGQDRRKSEMVPLLIKNSTHTNASIRARSVRALVKIAPLNGEAKSIVRGRLEDEDPGVRANAAHALVRFATNTNELLAATHELLLTKDPQVWSIALCRLLSRTKLQFEETQKSYATELGLDTALVQVAQSASAPQSLALVHLATLFPQSKETGKTVRKLLKSDRVETRASAYYALTLCGDDAATTMQAIVEASNANDLATIDLPVIQFIARNRPQTFNALKRVALESATPELPFKWRPLTAEYLASTSTADLLNRTDWFKDAVAADWKEDRWPF